MIFTYPIARKIADKNYCGTIHWFSEIEFRVTAICLLAPTDAYVMITEGTYIVVDNVIDFRIDKATCDPNPPDYLLRIDELKADTMKTTLEGIPQMTWERLEGLDTREFKIDANITYGCILTDGTFTESPLD